MSVPKLRFKEFDGDWSKNTIQSFMDNNYILDQMDGNHGELYPKAEEFSISGVPYISATDFSNGEVDFSSCKKLPVQRAKLFKKGIARNGDVLFAHNATVGPVALLKTDLDFVILSTTATYYRCNHQFLSNQYLKNYFASDYFVQQYFGIMSQSTRNQVPITTPRKLSISIPNLEEQTKIASFLSAVDEKISQLTKKHQLLSQYKQGMMQKLFSQQIRFKADDGSEFEEWEEKQLGDVCHFINGRAYKQTEWEKEGTPVIRLQNLTGSGKEYYYSTLNLPDHQYCYNNDLLYMWSATFGPIFWQGEKAIFHYHIWKVEVEPQQLDKQYMYYLLDEMTEKMKSSLNGSTMLHVTKQGMESTKKNLPSIEEQTKIANFLSAIDQKIDVVKEQLEQAKLWKKGLLQQMFV